MAKTQSTEKNIPLAEMFKLYEEVKNADSQIPEEHVKALQAAATLLETYNKLNIINLEDIKTYEELENAKATVSVKAEFKSKVEDFIKSVAALMPSDDKKVRKAASPAMLEYKKQVKSIKAAKKSEMGLTGTLTAEKKKAFNKAVKEAVKAAGITKPTE